ncbi:MULTISPECIES: DivIVA domain-containing protein [Bacillales]|uniref:DivIVA domain-containing protein n=1 Tax=Lysinibacillus louembei TaxID=1470088 RepID=A0ABZ0RV54_9BACI|nr:MULTISPECIES: DivIVA domain-containing protein [Bacillales]MCT6924030.1 DivIVA domain-containing protein [Metasolibacillus sp.]MCT6940112.1 DivIVA domain-containing protein [Metasolibacillus sp.]WPK12030.1 DivIVA domain-containing protein [Lysinibacillus louembei]
MPLSPLDIHNKEFTRGFRGYVEDEVNEFLNQIIKDYEIILRDKKELEEKVKMMSEQISHFNTLENTLQKSIVVAQDAAEELRRNSQKEAKLIVKEAEKNADRIVNDALTKARKITIEIDELKKQSKVFRNRFKMLVEAQLDLLNTDDWEHLLEYDVDLTDIQEQVKVVEDIEK